MTIEPTTPRIGMLHGSVVPRSHVDRELATELYFIIVGNFSERRFEDSDRRFQLSPGDRERRDDLGDPAFGSAREQEYAPFKGAVDEAPGGGG